MTWREQGWLCVSVPFTWLLKEARGVCLSHPTERVVVGGPAVRLMPEFLADVAEVETMAPDNPLCRANPEASRTTLGCPNACPFCGVRTIEGPFRELPDWRPAPVLCDSNFLASSDAHFDRTIERLKRADFREVDFNQGLEAKRLTKRRAARLAELNIRPRFAWDRPEEAAAVFDALSKMERAGVPRSRFHAVLCLIGFRETPEDAMYRLQTLKDRGFLGFAMRYQPLDALKKNGYIAPGWSERLLRDFCRYWNRQAWLPDMAFREYQREQHDARQGALALDGQEGQGPS